MASRAAHLAEPEHRAADVVALPRRRSRPRRLRQAFFALTAVAALALTYVVVTFVQVVAASGHDERTATDAIVVFGAAQYDGEPSGALRGLAVVGLDSDQLKLMHLLTKWAEVTLLGLFLLELVCKGLGATVLSVTTVARRGMGNDESV